MLRTSIACACVLLVSAGVAAADKPVKFSSFQTPLYPSKRCKSQGSSEEAPVTCPGRAPYGVEVGFSAWAMHVSVQNGDFSVQMPAGYIGKTLEWRLAD